MYIKPHPDQCKYMANSIIILFNIPTKCFMQFDSVGDIVCF